MTFDESVTILFLLKQMRCNDIPAAAQSLEDTDKCSLILIYYMLTLVPCLPSGGYKLSNDASMLLSSFQLKMEDEHVLFIKCVILYHISGIQSQGQIPCYLQKPLYVYPTCGVNLSGLYIPTTALANRGASLLLTSPPRAQARQVEKTASYLVLEVSMDIHNFKGKCSFKC